MFAYGPTGTGKTFTMVGMPNNPGIMVRALNELFQMMHESAEDDQFDVIFSEPIILWCNLKKRIKLSPVSEGDHVLPGNI